jgi:hypothetical protein
VRTYRSVVGRGQLSAKAGSPTAPNIVSGEPGGYMCCGASTATPSATRTVVCAIVPNRMPK